MGQVVPVASVGTHCPNLVAGKVQEVHWLGERKTMKQLINLIDSEAAATAQDQYSSAGTDKMPLYSLWSWWSLVVWSRVVWPHRGSWGTWWSWGAMWPGASMWSRGTMWAAHGSDRSLIMQSAKVKN